MFTVTFYSYKGGVGRTLALANVAYTLATEGSKARVVMLDFDLEAPGLDTLVPLTGGKGAGKGGILEYIAEYWNNPEANPEALPSLLPYVREVDAIPNLAVIPAGKKDERYQETLACLDWQSFYRVRQGYRFFEQLKRKIEVEFNPDYLLVDSRTGLADVAGITTHQLADLVVLVFNLNRQNLDGIKGCYHSIVSAPKPRRIKVMLVASPVPQGHLLDSGLVESRLEDATASMPDVVNYSRTGKEPVIQIPYHPLLALRDEVFVKEYPSHEISGIYRRVAETIRKSNPAEMKFLLEKAYRYWDENRFEEAEEEFRTIVRLHPKNAEGFYLYGDFLMKRERYKDATAQLEEACRLAENDIRYLSSLGMALAKENRIEAALDKLKKAESLGSKKEAVLHAISRLYDKMGDSMKAIEYWRKIRQVNPPPTRLDRIRSIQEFDRIASEFISASLNIPEDFDRRRFVERLEKSVAFDYTMKAGILQSAMAQDFRFQQIMELDNLLASQEEQLTKVLGDHLLVVSNKVRHGDLHHFLDEGDLKRLIKNEETDSANAFRLCLALSRMNEAEYREVLDIIDDAMNTEMAEPARKPFYRLWADALSALADRADDADVKAELLDKAIEKYSEACRLQPDDHEALNHWGIALANLARTREGPEREEMLRLAMQKFERAVGIKPDDHKALNNWGNALAILARMREGAAREEMLRLAMQKYERAVDIKHDDHKALNNWGNTLADLARMREGPEREEMLWLAMQKYERAVEIKPDYHEALYNWGNALANLARTREGPEREEMLRQAMQKYERAVEIKPDAPEVLNNWGIALADLARMREGAAREEMLRQAIQKYERAVDIKHDYHEALYNWGIALADLARVREGTEREEMLRQAMQKYERAVDIKHDYHEALNNWGNALANLALLREGPEREEMLWQALQKYERAVDIKHDYHEVLNNWGIALADLARMREGPEREEMLWQALQKYERAVGIKHDYHEALNNWGNALANLALLREGTAREEILSQAMQKYERAVDIKHDFHEALNNWGQHPCGPRPHARRSCAGGDAQPGHAKVRTGRRHQARFPRGPEQLGHCPCRPRPHARRSCAGGDALAGHAKVRTGRRHQARCPRGPEQLGHCPCRPRPHARRA